MDTTLEQDGAVLVILSASTEPRPKAWIQLSTEESLNPSIRASTEPRPKAWIQQGDVVGTIAVFKLQRSHARKHGYNLLSEVRAESRKASTEPRPKAWIQRDFPSHFAPGVHASTEPRPKAWIQLISTIWVTSDNLSFNGATPESMDTTVVSFVSCFAIVMLQRSHARKHGYNEVRPGEESCWGRFNGATPESMDTTCMRLLLGVARTGFNGATPESMDTTAGCCKP